MNKTTAEGFLIKSLRQSLEGADTPAASLLITGSDTLPSAFCVTALAAASIGVAGMAAAEYVSARSGTLPEVRVNRRLASYWFGSSVEAVGWSLPSIWDSVAGAYACQDGWIRLHTNAPHHRAAALSVLAIPDQRSQPATREQVAAAVRSWSKCELESAIVNQGGCAAAMRSAREWQEHPQGRAVAAEPLVAFGARREGRPPRGGANGGVSFSAAQPLRGVRVLDLTRVLAGPVATRFLAGLGADVLRVDPPDWDEPAVLADVTLGKRCTRLDLKTAHGRAVFEKLLADADILVHGYRPDALERLGLGAETRQSIRPGLIDVCLNAYGWTGPWSGRRGFDSLVQMSSGIAHTGMLKFNRDSPFPLPVQALDHATGYLMAAAVLRGMTEQIETGRARSARVSLARMALLLNDGPEGDRVGTIAKPTPQEQQVELERTDWGGLRRTLFPLQASGVEFRWARPAGKLGTSPALWS